VLRSSWVARRRWCDISTGRMADSSCPRPPRPPSPPCPPGPPEHFITVASLFRQSHGGGCPSLPVFHGKIEEFLLLMDDLNDNLTWE
jgi:hypothetical protein